MKKSILGGVAFFLTLSIVHAQGLSEKFKTPFTSYQVDNSKCNQLTHISGSKIFIQAKAFNTTSNQVEIHYREFITPLDILVNNIPMTTTEKGKTYQLESGGMFEIKAFENGKELQLKKGKKIEVQLAKEQGNQKMRKMEAYKLPNSFDGWNTLPNKVHNQSVGNDDDLWGSSAINNVDETEVEFGWGDDWGGSGWSDELQEQDSIRKVAFQTMAINEMGFYNYDYKLEGVNFVPITAKFDIDQKATQNTIYVVYDDINTVFYYPPYTWKNDFKLIDKKSYRMFSIDKNGKIAQLESKPNLNQVRNKHHTFSLITEKKIPASKEELASILKL